VFNWLASEDVSRSSPLARFTKAPAVYVHEGEKGALADGAFLPGYTKHALERPEQLSSDGEGLRVFLRAHARDEARGVVLVDSPDIDSTHERNRIVAQDLLDLADAVVFVSTPEKYNDEVCVGYLQEASGFGKRILCVLNKGGQEEVARDLEAVLERIFSQGASPPDDVRLIRIPYVDSPGQGTKGPWLETLRFDAMAPGRTSANVRARALVGTRRRLSRDLREVTTGLREELGQLDRIRADAKGSIEHAVTGYRDFLLGLDFYELDRVFERVLAHFHIPLLDDIYNAIRGLFSAVSQAVTRAITGRADEDAKLMKLRERFERDREKVKELYELARSEIAKIHESAPGRLAKAAQGWAPPPVSLEAVNADVGRFLSRADEEAELWIDAETRRHVQFFEEHPGLKAALHVMKGAVQIGFGIVSAYLTGGLMHGGPIEGAVSGLLTERGMKLALEKMGGVVHYQTLKNDYASARAEIFRAVLEQAVERPFIERVPQGSTPEALERVEAAALELEKGS
ncbi:hypothetical protein HY251_08100, partial [bacterium]|nr:hypothetical protein [bacterium]